MGLLKLANYVPVLSVVHLMGQLGMVTIVQSTDHAWVRAIVNYAPLKFPICKVFMPIENELINKDENDFEGDLDAKGIVDIGLKSTMKRMLRQKTARQWDRAPYEVDELLTNEKSHIPDEVLAQIPTYIFIAKFRDEEGDNIKTTIMPREIWTLHRRPKVASAVRVVHLEQFFRSPPWGTDYMRAHELMSSIQYDGIYDLIPKTKAIDNEKAFLKVKGSKFKYFDLIYSELELPLRLISQHLRVQKPPRYTEPFLHMAVVMALCVAERRQVCCDYAKFILESLIEANLKNSAKNKLYMNAGPMLTRVAYQALGMIENLLAASSQASLIQQAKYVPKAIRTTSSAASSRSTRLKKSSSEEERIDTDKEQDSQESAQEDVPKEVEAAVPSEYKRSDEEDTSTPLEKKSQKPRSREQVLMDEAMARVKARRKELADARAAKAAKTTKPMTLEEARKIRIENAKAIQKERRRIKADKKAQEEAEATLAAWTQEKEVIDLSGTVEYLKKLEREKHTAEQRAGQLAKEKIKEALSRKAEEPVLEPTQGSPKRPRQEEEEDIEHIQADSIPPSPIKTAQPMDKIEEEMQTDGEQHQPTDVDVPVLIIQEDEPTNEEAIQEVKSFDYTRLIQTLSRQFKCQQVVAKETGIQKERANKAYEEITNLRTALELSHLTRKEAQNHELIKNKKKMKEQLKYEDAQFQKLTASYNIVKTTLTTLLQNQEPISAMPSTSDSAAANTLAALQEELQTEKLQRQLLVSGFMSQTAQHKAKVK
ncbi:hypothetical protein L7F22_025266 [Adiantum nelumboides]|nr:hypothetical protein [Adiantum nelumboides]